MELHFSVAVLISKPSSFIAGPTTSPLCTFQITAVILTSSPSRYVLRLSYPSFFACNQQTSALAIGEGLSEFIGCLML